MRMDFVKNTLLTVKVHPFLLVLLLFVSTFIHGQFQHPGIYSTKAELEFVKQKIAEGKEPWKTAYNRLKSSNPTSRTPKAWVKVPGSSDPKERKDMDAMTLDGSHAYASALLFYFTGEKKYADYTINVLNKWSIFQKIGMPLYLTWGAPHFINAAELMKHTPNSGWKAADITKFNKMVNDYMWPIVKMPVVTFGSNHGCTAVESQFAIAIFLDDKTKFDQATTNAKWLLPKWFFYGVNNRLNGETNNTCRDLNHTKLGTAGIVHAMNSAYHQGLDLWSPNKARLTAFAKLHSEMLTGDKPVPSNICAWKNGQKGKIFCAGNVSWGSPTGSPPNCAEVAWEILFNHLNRRLGVNLPSTEKMLYRNRPKGSINTRTVKWETLLHANINPADITDIIITPNPKGPEGYVYAVDEQGTVKANVPVDIAYGSNGKFVYLENQRTDAPCTNANMGSDPIPGVKKYCFIRETKTSYLAEPMSVPGTLEAEHYNYGGNNVSYFDGSPENSGASASNFRTSESVDIDKGNGGYAVGWTRDNEWMEYDIDVASEGTYLATFTTSAKNSGGELELSMNGQALITSFGIPATSDFSVYTETSEEVTLPQGKHTLRVKIAKQGFNIDKIAFAKKVTTNVYAKSISEGLEVYPNPSNNGLFHLIDPIKYQVLNSHGALITSGKGDLIDLANQPKGIYLLKVENTLIKLVK